MLKNKAISKISQLFLLLVLILVFVIINFFIEDSAKAIWWNVVLVLVLVTFLLISNRVRKRNIKHIIQQKNIANAKIISLKVCNKNSYVLELEVSSPGGQYITSYVHHNPDQKQRELYKPEQKLKIYVNPLNKKEILIHQDEIEKGPHYDYAWGIIQLIAFVGLPLCFFYVLCNTERSKEIAYIQDDANNGKIWEVYGKKSGKIYINIIDPIANKTVKKIKEKKEKEFADNLTLFISQQNSNVIIMGLGSTPFFDVYNASTLKKISGIKELEKSNKKFISGIVNIELKWISWFLKDDVLEIVSTDGTICYYNIQDNLFIYSDQELFEYVQKKELEVISEHPVAFVNSPVSGSHYQKQIYAITSSNINNDEYLLSIVGQDNIRFDNFNEEENNINMGLKASLLSEEKFIKSRIIFYDTSIVVVSSLISMREYDDNKITAIDKTGKVLFVIPECDYPNDEIMKKNHFKIGSGPGLEFIRTKEDQMILHFGKYGALNFDLKTGKQLWKYEP